MTGDTQVPSALAIAASGLLLTQVHCSRILQLRFLRCAADAPAAFVACALLLQTLPARPIFGYYVFQMASRMETNPKPRLRTCCSRFVYHHLPEVLREVTWLRSSSCCRFICCRRCESLGDPIVAAAAPSTSTPRPIKEAMALPSLQRLQLLLTGMGPFSLLESSVACSGDTKYIACLDVFVHLFLYT